MNQPLDVSKDKLLWNTFEKTWETLNHASRIDMYVEITQLEL